MKNLKQTDPEISELIVKEQKRQMEGLELIPSENFVSLAVLRAMGCVLTNKYSEGYPGKRYYGGNEFVDEIEDIARSRVKKLFGFSHANVQPYSGSPANHAAYMAVASPGDKIMGLHLFHGGHLTHGWKVSFSAKYYKSVPYMTGKDGMLDYHQLEKQVKNEKPRVLFCGATAYPRLYDYKWLAEMAHGVDSYFVADIAHEAGLIAGKAIPGPKQADIVTTTTHKTLRGPRGAMILCNGNPSNPLKPCEVTRENLPTLIDRAVFPGLQGGPHNHTTAGIAVALKEAMQPEFEDYAAQIVSNAKALAATLLENGVKLVTGGTDNHLMVIELRESKISGKDAENALGMAGITVNKNTVPNDPRPPYITSGVRIGTPAITTRGMKQAEMEQIGEWIVQVLSNHDDKGMLEKIKNEVKTMCKDFMFY